MRRVTAVAYSDEDLRFRNACAILDARFCERSAMQQPRDTHTEYSKSSAHFLLYSSNACQPSSLLRVKQ
jgi:hypothetical protein